MNSRKESMIDALHTSAEDLQANKALDAILNDSNCILDSLKGLKSLLEDSNGNGGDVAAEVVRELKSKIDHFNAFTLQNEKSMNKQIRLFSNKIDNVSSKGVTMDTIYPFKKAGMKDQSEEMYIINMAVVLDLLNQGHFDLIDKLSEHLDFNNMFHDRKRTTTLSDKLQTLYKAFEPLVLISTNLTEDNFVPLLDWTCQNLTRLAALDPLFEMEVIKGYTLCVLSQNDDVLPTNFNSSHNLLSSLKEKWYYNYYLDSLAAADYQDVKRNLKHKFQRIYTLVSQDCSSLGKLPSASPVHETILVAHLSLKEFTRFCQLQKQGHRPSITENSLDATQLPFEVKLPDWLQHHSVFICPVSREETSEDDPPVFMPCGHMISTDTMKKLSRNCTRNFKCPYCPQNMTSRQCLEVDIVDLY